MNTKIYLLSFSFGLGLGTTTMHTSDPLGTVMKIAAEGHSLEHVTIKSASGSGEAAAIEQAVTEQEWQFMEWS